MHLKTCLSAIECYERPLFQRLLDGLEQIRGLKIWESPTAVGFTAAHPRRPLRFRAFLLETSPPRWQEGVFPLGRRLLRPGVDRTAGTVRFGRGSCGWGWCITIRPRRSTAVCVRWRRWSGIGPDADRVRESQAERSVSFCRHKAGALRQGRWWRRCPVQGATIQTAQLLGQFHHSLGMGAGAVQLPGGRHRRSVLSLEVGHAHHLLGDLEQRDRGSPDRSRRRPYRLFQRAPLPLHPSGAREWCCPMC